MIRTTPELVGGIIELDTSIDLTPFILTASVLVDEITGLSDERLELIERWLAAHFYCMRDPRTTRERAGSVEVHYQSKVDLNLALSHYGQTAMTLDTTGTLLAMSAAKGRRTASVTWLGTPLDETVDTIE